jgi:hypothetical protein
MARTASMRFVAVELQQRDRGGLDDRPHLVHGRVDEQGDGELT